MLCCNTWKFLQPTHLQAEEARGPVVARNFSRALYGNQHYFLSIDSHTRFGCGWDAKLVALHLSLNQTRAIVTAYPPHYDPLMGLQNLKNLTASRLAALDFDTEDNILRIGV